MGNKKGIKINGKFTSKNALEKIYSIDDWIFIVDPIPLEEVARRKDLISNPESVKSYGIYKTKELERLKDVKLAKWGCGIPQKISIFKRIFKLLFSIIGVKKK